MHSCESYVQSSEQSISVESLELPNSTIRNPFATGSQTESSISCSFWTKFNGNVFTAAPVSRFIFVHSNRFGLLVALTSKPPSENELADVSYVCFQTSCHPTELQSVMPLIETPAIVPLVTSPTIVPRSASLWHLGSHFWFLWIFLCFLHSCLRMRTHSWTMTCPVCLCHTIAFLCSCVHCNLVERRLDDLWQTRES